MSNKTAGTLALVGGILNLIGGLVIASISFIIALLLLSVGITTSLLGLTLFIVMIAIGAFSMLLGLLPISWRHEPENHRVGLIIIGVITIPSIGGILNLAAGIMATDKEAV
jgi:hypothetical protein